MTREKSPAQMIFDDIVKSSVTSVLKPIGFRKSALNFHRRHNAVVQVVNLQLSRGSTWDEKIFFVNVGLAFDALCELTSTPILEKPKESQCSERGTRARLEQLIERTPDKWVVHINNNLQPVSQNLESSMVALAEELELIDGLPAYREHRWFDRFRPKQENAQILYLLGDTNAAWQEVKALCKLFADRGDASRPEWWIEELKLSNLVKLMEAEKST